jgi:tight adherence protein B
MTAVVALLGALCGVGLLVAVAGIRGVALPVPRLVVPVSWTRRFDRLALRLAWGAGVGVITAAVTGWPVASLLAAAAGFTAPSLTGGRTAREAELARIEAIAVWAEMLRDVMAAAGGLEQSIIVTAAQAPPAIRAEVTALAARCEHERLAAALRGFAEQLNDPTGDLVVAALVLAAQRSPRQLGELLGNLADTARAEVAMRLRIAAGRARTRSATRIITAATIGFSLGLLVLNRPYLAAYDSLVGQAVLATVGACYAIAYRWIARSARAQRNQRFLTQPEPAGGR